MMILRRHHHLPLPKVQQATHASTGGHQGRIQHMYETRFLLDSRVGWLVGWLGWLGWLVGWLGWIGWVGLVTKLGGLVGCFFVKQVQNSSKVGMVTWIC